MRLRPLARAESRALDAQAEAMGLSTLVLMENAGAGAANAFFEFAPRLGRSVILCGPGNNGGDGAVVARRLDASGHHVYVYWICSQDDLSPDARTQFGILKHSGVEQVFRPAGLSERELALQVAAADWAVDALLGTGLNRPVAEPIFDLIESINQLRKPVLAIDVPSGLDCDTGAPLGTAIKARVTATLVAPKIGFSQPTAKTYVGRIRTVELGLPRKLIEPFLDPKGS